jgi:hypothetical protein
MICLMYEWALPFCFCGYEFLFGLGVFVFLVCSDVSGERTLERTVLHLHCLGSFSLSHIPPSKLLVYQSQFMSFSSSLVHKLPV